MKALGRLLLTLILLGNLLLLAALSVHVVRSANRVRVMPKAHLTLLETYEGVTNWTADDAKNHPEVVARVIASGHGDLLPAAATASASVGQK